MTKNNTVPKKQRDKVPRTKEDIERELLRLDAVADELEKEVDALVARRGW